MERTSWPISDFDIALQLQRLWGITALRIAPFQMGRARNTWVYHVQSATSAFCLKLKREVHVPGVVVSNLLADSGLHVSTPILSVNRKAWETINGLGLLVFPFIHGYPICMPTLDVADWCAIGRNLRAVHDTRLPDATRHALASETFTPAGRELLLRVEQAVSKRKVWSDSLQEQFVGLWSRWGSFPSEFFSAVCIKG